MNRISPRLLLTAVVPLAMIFSGQLLQKASAAPHPSAGSHHHHSAPKSEPAADKKPDPPVVMATPQEDPPNPFQKWCLKYEKLVTGAIMGGAMGLGGAIYQIRQRNAAAKSASRNPQGKWKKL